MSFITKLAAYTLRQMLGNSTAIYVEKLGQFFVDPTQALPNALNLANQQTWQLMELALAGDKLSERLKRWLISGQMRGILQPLREQVQQLGSNFRSECLGELQAARSAGVLAVGTGQELIALGQNVRVMVEPAALLVGAQQVVTQAVDSLQPYPRLAQLLANQDGGGALLITAFEYFLRQEIGKLPLLREELQINLLQQLAQDQLAGWEELHRLLTEQRTEIGEELAGIAQGLEEVLIMVREIRAILPNSAQRGPVSPRHSSILRSAADVKLLAELERRLSTMAPASHTPELLDYIGRLAMAVGVFNIAGERFSQAATAASAAGEATMQAEAHYNTYRALLEQRRWDEALVAMLAAAQLDPKRFALFPLDDYIPQRILGAGGFGVAFLCQHAHLGEQQVVKTLHTEELQLDAGRDIATIFREGSILTRLQHPSIIAVKHAGFADPDKQRLYLVMEYFPGVSLGDYLIQHGCLNLEQTAALAKPVAEALQAAHEQGIWHRDLKPDNLLVRVEKSGGWTVKLIDFGLAVRGKVVQASVVAGVINQSIMGQALGGTYQFSAPEQLGITAGKVGQWSDVYAFGKTLAYARFKTTQLTKRHYRELGEHPLADLLSDCLEQDIDQRPQDFSVVLQVLNTEDETKHKQEESDAARKAQEEQQHKADIKHGHYLIHADGTVTDTRNGLMWKRCAEGQTWDGKTCVGKAKKMPWKDITPNGEQRCWPAFAGHYGWRVPTVNELLTVLYCSSGKPKIWFDFDAAIDGSFPCEGDYQKPMILLSVFPDTVRDSDDRFTHYFWTASGAGHDYEGIKVDFRTGSYSSRGIITEWHHVRLVRGGQ